jgi:hypothetical protein
LIVGDDMNNPGPLHDDLLSPFAHLLSPGPAAAIGVGTLNSLAVVGVSMAARRIGGWTMQRWLLLACAALTWTMGSELLIDIWQAHAMLLPLLLSLVLLVGVGCGMTRASVDARGRDAPRADARQLRLQRRPLHRGGARALVVVGAAGQAPRAVRRLRSRTAAWSAALVAVLWAQPLWEQFFGPGGATSADSSPTPPAATSMSARGRPRRSWRRSSRCAVVARSGFSTAVPSTG